MENREAEIFIEGLTKSYGSETVLNDLTMTLTCGHTYCLMAPSGAGKTTLFRILMGLEKPDSGRIHGLDGLRISAVFQEDRLLEGLTAVQNLRLVTGRRRTSDELRACLVRLLPEESLSKPVAEFSGGMKRRTAILRALLAPSDVMIMDEPFTGLDHETKLAVVDVIREYAQGKLLLVSTHSEEDISLLNAELLRLDSRLEGL